MRKAYSVTHKRLYSIHYHMLYRCYNDKSINFKHYGGRGIHVCPEWQKDLGSFVDWAEQNGYKDGLELDRINNNGHYCPENCRWVTRAENNQNKNRVTGIVSTDIKQTKQFGEEKFKDSLYEKNNLDGGEYSHVYKIISDFLARKEEIKNEKEERKLELKKIIDDNYCFFQFL